MKVCSFISHRHIIDYSLTLGLLRKQLDSLIKQGVSTFIVNQYGMFENMVEEYFRDYLVLHNDVNVIIVKDNSREINISDFFRVKTINNFTTGYLKDVIDRCDIIVAYVDEKKLDYMVMDKFKYAKATGKEIINLFNKDKEQEKFCFSLDKALNG